LNQFALTNRAIFSNNRCDENIGNFLPESNKKSNDGVQLHANTLIPGSDEFIRKIQKRGTVCACRPFSERKNTKRPELRSHGVVGAASSS
jgi:hypothetical protein